MVNLFRIDIIPQKPSRCKQENALPEKLENPTFKMRKLSR